MGSRIPRWPLVVLIVVALAALVQTSLLETTQAPEIGLRSRSNGERLIITWVQPASLVWDAGVRPGDVVRAIDGQFVTERLRPDAVRTAEVIQVQTPDGDMISASTLEAEHLSGQRQWMFLALAVAFVVVAGVTWVLATDAIPALAVLLVGLTAAVALVASIASPFGSAWALGTVYTSLHGFGASLCLLFLVFPVNWLATQWGRLAAVICVGVTIAAIIPYPWIVARHPAGYDALQVLSLAILITQFVGAAVLAFLPLTRDSLRQSPTRHALGLLSLGMIAALLPLCLLLLAPRVADFPDIVPQRFAALSLVFLPVSLSTAVLSRQFFGITRLVRRGLIALIVWMSLTGIYSAALVAISRWHDGRSQSLGFDPLAAIVTIMLIAATFWPVQVQLRYTLERLLFRDVYDYKLVLNRLSLEIAQLSELDAIANHVMQRLGITLDLSWITIALDDVPNDNVFRWDAASVAGDAARLTNRLADRPAHVVPLVVDGRIVGQFAVGPKRHDIEPTLKDRALIATLAPLVASALDHALLVRQLKRQITALASRERDLARFNARLLKVQEQERRRLALDLHDDPLQRAVLLTRELSGACVDPRSSSWRASATSIVESLRAISAGLRPPTLDDFGLVAGLEALVNQTRASNDIEISLRVDPSHAIQIERLPPELETALYRVAQEALNNCCKHANATHISVNFSQRSEHVLLRVADDGQGFGCTASYETVYGQGVGLLGMQERLQPWRGRVTLEENQPSGLVLFAHVPLLEGKHGTS